jgi:hypothetical protein
MKTFARFGLSKTWAQVAVVALVLVAGAAIYPLTALQTTQAANGYIQGKVTSASGPEAGVWVIAETKELATPMIKIVVTDDGGNYVLPELPSVNYSVWVRGYGLADSKKVTAKPGTAALNLTAVKAKDAVEEAKIYPGSYWMQMLEPPAKSQFPWAVIRRRNRHSKAGCTISNPAAISAIRSETELHAISLMCLRRSPNSRPPPKHGITEFAPAFAAAA